MTAIRATLVLSLAILATALGCDQGVSGGKDIEHATQVTFAELKEATDGHRFFLWIGSDEDFHYFRTEQGRFYRLTSEFEMPAFQKIIEKELAPGEIEWFATIDGDEIKKPDDEVLKQWLHEQ